MLYSVWCKVVRQSYSCASPCARGGCPSRCTGDMYMEQFTWMCTNLHCTDSMHSGQCKEEIPTVYNVEGICVVSGNMYSLQFQCSKNRYDISAS